TRTESATSASGASSGASSATDTTGAIWRSRKWRQMKSAGNLSGADVNTNAVGPEIADLNLPAFL
ncbi:hypothetical protein PoB_002715400, partial [Plakobranchus ocellatus]